MRQKLGQHFLRNRKYLSQIISALQLKKGDTVVEIGSGHGELTDCLIARLQDYKIAKFNIIAIERDEKLAEKLRQKYSDRKNIEIIKGDALKVLPKLVGSNAILKSRGYKLVGNIPYYITGYLLRLLGEADKKPERTVITVQKEVAERICAVPPKMNLLASSVQIWAVPKIISVIPKKYFYPPPKVESVVLLLETKRKIRQKVLASYFRFVKILFKQPRKTIFNNLRGTAPNLSEILRDAEINPRDRPQELAVSQIEKLALLSRLSSGN